MKLRFLGFCLLFQAQRARARLTGDSGFADGELTGSQGSAKTRAKTGQLAPLRQSLLSP